MYSCIQTPRSHLLYSTISATKLCRRSFGGLNATGTDVERRDHSFGCTLPSDCIISVASSFYENIAFKKIFLWIYF